MKFTDGYWQVRKGLHLQNPVEIRDIETDERSVTVYAATKRVETRGDTLNATLLTVRYSTPMKDVIRVQFFRHKGAVQTGPAFPLFGEGAAPQIERTEEEVRLTSGSLSVTIPTGGGWQADFRYGNERITGSGKKAAGHIEGADGATWVREQLDLGVGEYVYGLGERFTPFVKNGQVVDIWNEDGGTSSEQAYKNVPFYVTNRGYGVFVNHPEKVSFEVASENVSKVQFSVPGEYLEYFMIGGGSIKAALDNYTALTGRPALPPAWSYGLWLTTSFTTSYDEQTVNTFIDGMFERDIPLRVFHFDCFWMKEYQWCDFVWDKDVFPDPKGMLSRLKEKGLSICVWINPYIAQKSYLFEEGVERGYLLKRPNGDVWQWDLWQAGMGLVDFTNPEATDWYKGKLKELVEMGVDSFKTDFGERIPTDVVYHDGSDPMKMHNYYTYLYNKAVFEVLEETLGVGEAMLFARSATAGCQQFPVHWGGDCSANYDSMAETLRGGLSLGLSGFGFWSHDISGFERTAPPDIYKRWVAFGLMSSHSRLHGNESYRVPWLFGDEAVDVLRHFTKLKNRLMPYLFSMSRNAAAAGTPLMRAMVLEFPNDPSCAPLDLQYMLGDSLLVAPIFNDQGTVQYYVPEGRWTDLQTNEVVEGGRWYKKRYDYFGLPLLVKPNTLLAVGAVEGKPDYDYAEGASLHLFELEDGTEAKAEIVDMKGARALCVTASRSGDEIAFEADRSGKWEIVLRNVHAVSSVEGAVVQAAPEGARLIPNAGGAAVKIRLG